MWLELLEAGLIIVDLIAVPVCFGLLIRKADLEAVIERQAFNLNEVTRQRDELLAERRARAGNGKIKTLDEVEVQSG